MFLFKSRKTIYLTRLHDTLGDDSCLDTFLAVGERESFSWLLLIFWFFALIWPNSWIPNRWFSSFLYCKFFLFPIQLIFDKLSDTFVDPTYEKSRVPLQFSSFLLKWALFKNSYSLLHRWAHLYYSDWCFHLFSHNPLSMHSSRFSLKNQVIAMESYNFQDRYLY